MSTDDDLLVRLRDMWDECDPPPAVLADLACFALDHATADDEVLDVVRGPRLAAVRGDERSQLITFDSASLTIMVNVTAHADGSVRLDGWITPPAAYPVELRLPTATRSTSCDGNGRFAFTGVVPALAQFSVRANGTVTTPAIAL
ncbi:hypothetical protein [Umezawaea sp.]|uniref:hypothetical protein n=1 Tax=Umezawaea sp. TaxID=1955258 RepID=UPI002ED1E124